MKPDPFTASLFATVPIAAGSLACGIEIAAAMADALERARKNGISRKQVAERMAYLLGEKFTEAMLNAYTAPSHHQHEISLRRAMAFDAALEEDVLLGMYVRKRGNRKVITHEEAAYIELGHIHQEEKELAERKRALQVMLKTTGGRP